MQSSIGSFLRQPLAALLALPLAALTLAAVPVHAHAQSGPRPYVPAQVAAPGVAIFHFMMQPQGRLEPGHDLRFRLTGAPGGQAWVQAPGIARPIPLRETAPGVYEANYTLRVWDDPDNFFRSVGHLRRGDASATARVEFRGPVATRDGQAPRVTQVTPANGQRVGARGFTLVAARLSDRGSGVDPASVRLRVDGRDVTRNARVGSGAVRYAENLRPGRHVAEVLVRDRAGNASRSAWSFVVAGWDPRDNRH